MLIVLDASVTIKALLRAPALEADSERAVRLWRRVRDGEVEVREPVHWLAEVCAVLARLSPSTLPEDILDLHLLDFEVDDSLAVFQTAGRLALALDHHLFDTLYHAVALESGEGVLVTADERYFHKARQVGQIVRLAELDS